MAGRLLDEDGTGIAGAAVALPDGGSLMGTARSFPGEDQGAVAAS
jgi:hypothetical protein